MKYRTWGAALLTVGVVAGLGACASGGGDSSENKELSILIGTSGDAETTAVQAAADAWAADNDAEVEVVVASDLTQQLSQGFAGGDAPDLFYMSWDQFATYASNGYLDAYADDLANAGDFYPALSDTFTYDGTFTCAPKDFSTLGLIINTDLWAAAGLTDADIPTDWASLEAAATKLTAGDTVGLSFGLEYARLGVFMNQAGGQLVDGDTVTADSPENLAGLEYVQKLHDAGVLKWPSEIDAGWGGEALGAGKAAMVIEGPWIRGIEGDFPDTNYASYELPAGPGGPATFSFTNCWGIPEGSPTADDAVSLVEFLTSDDQQVEFANAYGVLPSSEAAAATYAESNPAIAGFVAGADYAVTPVAFDGAAAVTSEFNARLADFGGADFASILADFQAQLEAAYADAG